MRIAHISIEECKHRTLYRLISRNLSFGVFDMESNAFVGIREKFGSRFLDKEFHYDTGAPFGTAHPVEPLAVLPEDIKLLVCLPGSVDGITGRAVAFDEERKTQNDWGWYFVDTGEYDMNIKPYVISNKLLFEWLKDFK